MAQVRYQIEERNRVQDTLFESSAGNCRSSFVGIITLWNCKRQNLSLNCRFKEFSLAGPNRRNKTNDIAIAIAQLKAEIVVGYQCVFDTSSCTHISMLLSLLPLRGILFKHPLSSLKARLIFVVIFLEFRSADDLQACSFTTIHQEQMTRPTNYDSRSASQSCGVPM